MAQRCGFFHSLAPGPLWQARLAPGQAQNETRRRGCLISRPQPPCDECFARPKVSTSKSKTALSGHFMISHAHHMGALTLWKWQLDIKEIIAKIKPQENKNKNHHHQQVWVVITYPLPSKQEEILKSNGWRVQRRWANFPRCPLKFLVKITKSRNFGHFSCWEKCLWAGGSLLKINLI